MVTIAVVAGALAAWVFTLIVGARAAFVVLDRKSKAGTEDADGLQARLATLEIQVAGLPSLWEQERVRAQQAYARARAAQSAANRRRAQLDDDEEAEGDDDEGQGVLPFDADGSDQRGMFTLPGSVAGPQPDPRRLLPFLLNKPGAH